MDTEYFLKILYSHYCQSYSDRLPFGARLEDELLTLRLELEKIPEEQREPLRMAAEHACRMTANTALHRACVLPANSLHATLR